MAALSVPEDTIDMERKRMASALAQRSHQAVAPPTLWFRDAPSAGQIKGMAAGSLVISCECSLQSKGSSVTGRFSLSATVSSDGEVAVTTSSRLIGALLPLLDAYLLTLEQ